MRTTTRVIIFACGLLVIAEALALWNATGRAGFTRYYDPVRAERERSTGAPDLFAHTGLEDNTGKLEVAPNDFAFGLAPGGLMDRNALSVAAVALPSLLIMFLVVLDSVLSRRKSPAPSAGRGRP